MNATQAALLGTVIGAITGLAGAVLTNLVAVRNERLRQKEASRATLVQTLREQVGVAFKELFTLQHATNWITWFAEHDPSALNSQMINSYDSEIHNAYPKLLGAMAMVAALDLIVYEELRMLMQRVYDLEEEVAIALRGLGARPEAATRKLRICLATAYALERSLPSELARIMEIADKNVRR